MGNLLIDSPRSPRSDAARLQRARNLLLAATAVSVVLAFIPYAQIALYPIRLFVTFVHESGHAITTVLTGGQVQSLKVDLSNASGVTMVEQSALWGWLRLSGGYLGSTIFGAMLLQVVRLGRNGNSGRAALVLIAAFVLAATLLWVRDPGTFALGVLLTVLFGAAARFASRQAAEFLVSFLAVQCCLNAFIDLRNLLFLTTYTQTDNDAVFMSRQYALPPVFWAVLWSAVALAVLAISLRVYLRPARNRPLEILK